MQDGCVCPAGSPYDIVWGLPADSQGVYSALLVMLDVLKVPADCTVCVCCSATDSPEIKNDKSTLLTMFIRHGGHDRLYCTNQLPDFIQILLQPLLTIPRLQY